MVAYITHYVKVNGIKAKPFVYEAEVRTQAEIERHRHDVLKRYENESHDEDNPLRIFFTIKQKPPCVLQP